jgi:hypothetical protein
VPDVLFERGARATEERTASLETLFAAFETGLADSATAN